MGYDATKAEQEERTEKQEDFSDNATTDNAKDVPGIIRYYNGKEVNYECCLSRNHIAYVSSNL